VASAVFTQPGVVEVTYVVGEGLEEMEVGVSLCGVAVPGGPWRPHAGFMAKGVHIATMPSLLESYCNSFLAVSSDGSLMVLSNARTDTLDVYRTEDGSHVRTLGGLGTGPGEFDRPYSLCMTARDTVLVGELYSCTQHHSGDVHGQRRGVGGLGDVGGRGRRHDCEWGGVAGGQRSVRATRRRGNYVCGGRRKDRTSWRWTCVCAA